MSLKAASSSTTTSNTSAWNSKSKQNSMNEFIQAVRDYRNNRADETVALMNRHLQLLGVSVDTSIFDPNTSVVCEFFVSMFDLLSLIEPRSSLSWGCVSVLQTACKNYAARNQLIHTYQFIPPLSCMLGDHLPLDKRIRLLSVIQQLSCGVKISWIIPNLEHLMGVLLRWLQKENETEQVVLLCLSIVVNLCFKNLPAMYTLSKCVDIKDLIKNILTLKTMRLEPYITKLFIIFDYMHGVVPPDIYVKLLVVTFQGVKESFGARDPILLRQNIDFYLDVKIEGDNIKKIVAENFKTYPEYVDETINIIDQKFVPSENKESTDGIVYDPECMSLVFKFLKSIIDWRLPILDQHYERVTTIALNWIQTDAVAADALSVLTSVVRSVQEVCPESQSSIMEVTQAAIPIMIISLQQIDEDTIISIEQCQCLSSIMSLLKVLVNSSRTHDRVMEYLTPEQLQMLFQLAIGDFSITTTKQNLDRPNNANNFTPEAFALYMNALSLVSNIAKRYDVWQAYFDSILKIKQIQAIIAETLYSGNADMRCIVLDIIAGCDLFPTEAVANSMSEICKSSVPGNLSPIRPVDNQLLSYTMITTHSRAPDEAIKILNEARANQRINVSTCDVMELYEYKISTMGHAERAAMASVEAASSRCTHLQHQVAQLTAELSRIRQLFLHTQQVQKDDENKIKALEATNRELRVDKKMRVKLQEEMSQRNAELENVVRQIEVLNKLKAELELEKEKAEKIITKLEEALKKHENVKKQKDESIKSLQMELQASTRRCNETEILLQSTETELAQRSAQLENALRESEERRTLLDSIMKLVHSRK